MERWEPQWGGRPWPEGLSVLQVYAPVDLSWTRNKDLARTLPAWMDAMRTAPVEFLTHTQFHVNLGMITDAAATSITAAERERLVAGLRNVAQRHLPFRGWAGSALAHLSGVILDITQATPLVDLAHEIRLAIREARPAIDAAEYRLPKPHIPLAYATEPGSSTRWQEALHQVDPAVVPLRLDEIALVEVTRSWLRPDGWVGPAWTTLATIPLGDGDAAAGPDGAALADVEQ